MATPRGELLEALQTLAPISLAESWDNVGLLIDAADAATRHDSPKDEVGCVALTIDLTEEVLVEARGLGATWVVAYHPPIFQPLHRLTRRTARERIVLDAIRHGVSVYSPHTALDAVVGGVNDWLAEAVGQGPRRPLQPATAEEGEQAGMGRRVALDSPASLESIVARIKDHLGLQHVRVAASPEHARGERIGVGFVCAGAGGSVLSSVDEAGLFLTGEMRHHDVAARIAAGSSVVLCDHTNTERGYLPILANKLSEALQGATQVEICQLDRDPLRIV